MTKEEFFRKLDQLSQDVREFISTIPNSYEGFIVPRFSVRPDGVIPKIFSNDWVGIVSFCENTNLELDSKKINLDREQNKLNILFQKLHDIKEGFAEFSLKPNTFTEWDEARNQMISKMIEAGISLEKATDTVDKLGNRGGLNNYKFIKKIFNIKTENLDIAYKEYLACSIYNLQAITFSKYNIASAVTQNLPFDVSEKIDSLNENIVNKQSRIFELAQAQDKDQLINFVTDFHTELLLQTEQEIIPILADTDQKLRATQGDFTENGGIAMRAGTLLHDTFFAITINKWLLWICNWHQESISLSNFFEQTSKLANVPIEFNGLNVDIATLVNNPNEFDNRDLIVEGLVKNLTITQVSATKVVSTANVINTTDDKIKIVLPHIHLDSGGIVNDTYAKISGKFLVNNPEANDQPAISIDIFAYKELAVTNWNAWLRNELRIVLDVPPHNLACEYSLLSGNDGAINPIKYNLTVIKTKSFTFKITTP